MVPRPHGYRQPLVAIEARIAEDEFALLYEISRARSQRCLHHHLYGDPRGPVCAPCGGHWDRARWTSPFVSACSARQSSHLIAILVLCLGNIPSANREHLPNLGLLEAERSLLVGREVRWTPKKPVFPPAKGFTCRRALRDSVLEIKPQSREDERGQRRPACASHVMFLRLLPRFMSMHVICSMTLRQQRAGRFEPTTMRNRNQITHGRQATLPTLRC
jgi:hypothetical protein